VSNLGLIGQSPWGGSVWLRVLTDISSSHQAWPLADDHSTGIVSIGSSTKLPSKPWYPDELCIRRRTEGDGRVSGYKDGYPASDGCN